MKPLDLERFEGHTPGPWTPFIKGRTVAVMTDGKKEVISWTGFDGSDFPLNEQAKNAKLIAAAPQLLAELKALRVWRQTINKAVEEGLYDENKVDMYNVILDAYNAAETELNDGKF